MNVIGEIERGHCAREAAKRPGLQSQSCLRIALHRLNEQLIAGHAQRRGTAVAEREKLRQPSELRRHADYLGAHYGRDSQHGIARRQRWAIAKCAPMMLLPGRRPPRSLATDPGGASRQLFRHGRNHKGRADVGPPAAREQAAALQRGIVAMPRGGASHSHSAGIENTKYIAAQPFAGFFGDEITILIAVGQDDCTKPAIGGQIVRHHDLLRANRLRSERDERVGLAKQFDLCIMLQHDECDSPTPVHPDTLPISAPEPGFADKRAA